MKYVCRYIIGYFPTAGYGSPYYNYDLFRVVDKLKSNDETYNQICLNNRTIK